MTRPCDPYFSYPFKLIFLMNYGVEKVAAASVSMSGYAGILMSTDDFFTTSQQLMVPSQLFFDSYYFSVVI